MHGVKDVLGAASATALLCARATMTTTRNAGAIPSPFPVVALGRDRPRPCHRNNPSPPRESVVYELSPRANPLGAQAALPYGAHLEAFQRLSYWARVSFRCGITPFHCPCKRHWPYFGRRLWLGCRALSSPAGNHRVEAELVQPTLCSPNPFCFTNNRVQI